MMQHHDSGTLQEMSLKEITDSQGPRPLCSFVRGVAPEAVIMLVRMKNVWTLVEDIYSLAEDHWLSYCNIPRKSTAMTPSRRISKHWGRRQANETSAGQTGVLQ